MRILFLAAAIACLGCLAGCGGGGGSGDGTDPVDPGPATSAAEAARLLEQTSFGTSDAAIAQVQSGSVADWIDAQMALPATGYGGIPEVDPSTDTGCPAGTPPSCRRDNYSVFPVQTRFFRNALSAPDQLRQRVALALSQIFVVSGNDVDIAYAMAEYQKLLLDGAFGSYRTLLENVTLSPAMGRYLDMVDNDKPNPELGIEPNENYAREVLQLFSIGVDLLEADGASRLDAQGHAIPSYDQDTVEGFARVFTGWTYPTRPGRTPHFINQQYYYGSMTPIAEHHDGGAKLLLGGALLPAGQTPEKDLADALDNIANHPNVGPFIGRQLIQHLVTTNPSPAYVTRISAVFANDGRGNRGNLGAVVRAILLDAEARGAARAEAAYGKLREPALFIASVLRGIGGASDGVDPRDRGLAQGQNIFRAPSVFNFYPPDYPLQGTTLDGGSFGIFDATTAFARINFINRLLSGAIEPDPTVPGATGTYLDLAAWQALAADPGRLIERIDRVLFHGAMSAALRNTLQATLAAIPAGDGTERARAALYLALSSVQFQVER